MNKLQIASVKTKSLLLTILLLAPFQFLLSQAITIDSGFNGTGRLVTDYRDTVSYLNFRTMNVTTLVVQADDKIVMAGSKIDSLLLSRYNFNGTPDSSFGSNGIAAIFKQGDNANPLRIRVLPDSKIIVLVWENDISKYSIYRYLPDGKPDSSFGQDGKAVLNLPSAGAGISLMELQRDGKILLAGSISQNSFSWPGFYITRLNPGGGTDNSFGHSGEVSTFFSYIKNDTLNSDFYTGGAGISDLVIQKDGKIIACGTTATGWNGYLVTDSVAIIRYNTDGSLDDGFNGDGKLTFDIPNVNNPYATGTIANAVCLQPDGKIVIGGGWYSTQTHGQWQKAAYTLIRLLPNGTTDSSFDADGVKVFTEGAFDECVKTFVQSDGKILLVGNAAAWGPFLSNLPEMSLARVEHNGTIDTRFGPYDSWTPVFYNNSGNKIISPAYTAVMKGQRLYVFGEVPNQYDKTQWGHTIFAFKIDGIAVNPATLNVCAPGAVVAIPSDLPGTNYQWQLSTDSVNFNNISNNAYYSGVNTSSLAINNIPFSWNLYRYRCVTENSISNVTTLHFLNANENEWTGALSNAWEDPANWLCGTVPGINTIVIINNGNVVIHSNVTIRNIQLRPGSSLTVGSGYSLSVYPSKD